MADKDEPLIIRRIVNKNGKTSIVTIKRVIGKNTRNSLDHIGHIPDPFCNCGHCKYCLNR